MPKSCRISSFLMTIANIFLSLRCKLPPEIENGVGSGDHTVGAVYSFRCNSGYEFSKGVTTMTFQCGKDGKTSFLIILFCW